MEYNLESLKFRSNSLETIIRSRSSYGSVGEGEKDGKYPGAQQASCYMHNLQEIREAAISDNSKMQICALRHSSGDITMDKRTYTSPL